MFGGILLNHICAGPLRVVGKALHIISFGTPWRYIVVLKVAMWSHRSCVPSYESNEGILNLEGRGWLLMEVMKGEPVWWTKSSTWFIILIFSLTRPWPSSFDPSPFPSVAPYTKLYPLNDSTLNIFSFSNFLTLSLPFHTSFMIVPSLVDLSSQLLIMTG